MKKLSFAFFAIFSLFGLSVFSQSIAITNARIFTVSGAEIAKGTIVIRDGLIEAVGEAAKVPADAKIFDGTGLNVYPGLIDAYTSLGVPESAARPDSPGAEAERRHNRPQTQITPFPYSPKLL